MAFPSTATNNKNQLNMAQQFSELEVGDLFFFKELYFEKNSSLDAKLVSDTKYEGGRAKFLPFFGARCNFAKTVEVEHIEGELHVHKVLEKTPGNPTRKDWPASKHPG